MFQQLQIKDKKYFFLPHTITYFNYSPQLASMEASVLLSLSPQESNNSLKELGDLQLLRTYLLQEVKAAEKIEKYLAEYKTQDIQISGCDINVFYGCNLSCKYCFASGGGHGKSGAMSQKNVKAVIDFIMANSGKREEIKITIVGGEPLLNTSAIKQIAEYGNLQAKSWNKRITFKIITNGTLLSPSVLEMLDSLGIGYLISMDSHLKEVNDFLRPSSNNKSSYDAINRNWGDIVKRNNSHVNVTVTPYNMNIMEIAENLYNRGIYYIHFEEVTSSEKEYMFTWADIENLKKEYDKLADLIINKISRNEKFDCYPLLTFQNKIHTRIPTILPCSTLTNRFAFSPEGNIYPCDMLMYDNYCVGNIKTGFNYQKIDQLKYLYETQNDCEGCWARFLCGGHCLSGSLWENTEQKKMRCELKRHKYGLKLYIYDYIIHNIPNYIF